MQSDNELGVYLAKQMLAGKKRISIPQILSELELNDRSLRESLIRLYYQGKIFGTLDGEYFYFNTNESTITLEDMIDWAISEFDLGVLIANAQECIQPVAVSQEPECDSTSMTIPNQVSQTEVEITRAKETAVEDQISVESRFLFAGNKLNLRIFMQNKSNVDIVQVRLKVQYPKHLIRFVGIRPNLEYIEQEDATWFACSDLSPNVGKNINILFLEKQRGKIEVDGYIEYRLITGEIKYIYLQHTVYEFAMPHLTPYNIDICEVRAIMKNPGFYKNIIAFGVPENLSLEQAQSMLVQSVETLGLANVSQIKKEDSIMEFLSGTVNTQTGEQIGVLVVPQVKDRVMQIYAASQNDQLVSNIHRHAYQMLHLNLMQEGFIGQDNPLVDLNCIRCGAVLGQFPPRNTQIKCRFCQAPQIPWN
jgi:hypothetical protein